MPASESKPATTPSKDLPPFTGMLSVFLQNQFRTRIDLPTKAKYPQVEGKCALVTGSNTGLGLESSTQLLSLGLARLIMGVRSLSKGEEAAKRLRASYPAARIDVWELEMESYDSIRAFVAKCSAELERLDVAILNAGVSSPNHPIVSETTGHERTVQINHYGTALLSILLLPVLQDKCPGPHTPRLTLVNSVTSSMVKLPNKDARPFLASFDDTSVKPWDGFGRYGQSKLLSQLFTVRLSDHIPADRVTINMVDPGLTGGTGLQGDSLGVVGRSLLSVFHALVARPLNKGAATYVDAVFGHGPESHGCFLMSLKVSPLSSWYYSEGKPLSDAVWDETIQELKSTGNIEQILGI